MTRREFMVKHKFEEKDMRNLARYEQARSRGVMNMFDYLSMMKNYRVNGGEHLATWIIKEGNYEEYISMLEDNQV